MRTASLVVLSLVLCCVSYAAVPSYTITDLGTLYGIDSYGTGINNLGQAVGYSSNQDGDFRAFLYTPAKSLKDLGTLGGYTAIAYGINDSGQVVGYSGTDGLGDRGFIYTEQSGILDLGVPPPNDVGANSSMARAINNSSQVAGYAQTPVDFSLRAFLLGPDGLTDVGTLGGSESYGFGINSSGQVVGQAATSSGGYHAFLYTPGVGIADLGLLQGGIYSVATDVNDSGSAVGYCWTSQNQNRVFVCVPGNPMSDLGTLGGTGAQAYGISNSGLIVGDVDMPGGTRGFVYESSGSIAQLATLGGPQSHARGINDSGQIVGFANTADGVFHAVVWSPITERPQTEVKMQVFPRTLNPKSNGRWVTCWIKLTSGGKSVRDIDVKSLGADEKEPLTDVWWDIHRIRHKRDRDYHPCQLPDALMERIIRLSTNEGDVVLDALCGTGTTALAARRLNRRFVAIDLDPTYVAITRDKLQELDVNGRVQRESTRKPKREHSKRELQLQLRNLAAHLGRLPTPDDVRDLTDYDPAVILSLFPTWGKALKAAKLESLDTLFL